MKINEELKLHSDEYIENKVYYHTDYSSYGNLNLRQTETQYNYYKLRFKLYSTRCHICEINR